MFGILILPWLEYKFNTCTFTIVYERSKTYT